MLKSVDLREKDLATLQAIFRQFPFIKEVRIFGSRANGTARRASDIDLAISAPGATKSQWLELKEAIEEAPIIYQFDLVLLENTLNSSLLEKINREGATIFP